MSVRVSPFRLRRKLPLVIVGSHFRLCYPILPRSSMSDDAVRRMWRIRTTCYEMLADRGYYTDEDPSFEAFKARNADAVEAEKSVLRGVSEDKRRAIIVLFPAGDKKSGVKPVRELIDLLAEDELAIRGIVVTPEPLGAFGRDAVSKAASSPPHKPVEAFSEPELLVNITRHQLVPKHVPLTDAEKKQLLARYKISEFALPRMITSDPVARYFGLRKGQVVKIIRPSETAGRYVTYRLLS